MNKMYVKIPQVGTVVTGDDVEIGANTCIDRGALNNTTIGNGTKIDDLVMIGHNCKVGNNVVLSGRVGMAGSTTIGDNCQAGGGAGFAGHLSVPAGTIIGGGAGVPGTIDTRDTTQDTCLLCPIKNSLTFFLLSNVCREMRRSLKRVEAKLDSLNKTE